ncbi:MAG: alanine racemase [Bacteroidota bacterium]|nr:alanine racemase [Bacteroidota bacterium]
METGNITGPQLVIDRDKCLGNIEYMLQKAKDNNLIFRPHFKTHQSKIIGRWFKKYGVDRITVSSLKMAYYFANDGWQDILVGIAYNPREYPLYEKLSGRCRIQATVSCPETCRILAGQCRFPLTVMIKIDTGYNRTGIRWDDTEGLRQSVKYLRSNNKIRIRGLMTHDGSTYGLNSRKKILEQYEKSVHRLNYCRENSDMKDLEISIGDTPSASVVDNFNGIDELRPGNFIFYDLMQYINGSCHFNKIAIVLLCPVIDIRPPSGTVVVHGGAVHFSKDNIVVNGKKVYGMLAELDKNGWHRPKDETYISSLSQEHGIIDCPSNGLIKKVMPGDLLTIIPVHSCLTADCMESYMLTTGEIIDHMRHAPQDSDYSLL